MEHVVGIGGYFVRAKGGDVDKQTQEMEGVGRFGWVTDPEGNRVELWQPA